MDALFGLFQVLVALSLACVVAEFWMWRQRDPEEQYQRQVDLMEAWAAEGPEALSDWRSFGFYGLGVQDFLRHRWAYYWEPALVNWLKGNDRVAPWPWQVRRWLIWNYGEAWHNFKVKAQNKLWWWEAQYIWERFDAQWVLSAKGLLGYVWRLAPMGTLDRRQRLHIRLLPLPLGFQMDLALGAGFRELNISGPLGIGYGWSMQKPYSRRLAQDVVCPHSDWWKMGGDFDGDIQIVRAMEEVRMRVPEQDEADTWVVTVEVVDANDAVDFYWHLRLYPSLDGMVREPLHRVDIHSSVGLVYALNEIYHCVGHEEEALLLALGQPDTVVARQPVELGVLRYDSQVQRLGWQLYEYYRNRQ